EPLTGLPNGDVVDGPALLARERSDGRQRGKVLVLDRDRDFRRHRAAAGVDVAHRAPVTPVRSATGRVGAAGASLGPVRSASFRVGTAGASLGLEPLRTVEAGVVLRGGAELVVDGPCD